jgi:hypothetical protein
VHAWRESNPQPTDSKSGALSIELQAHKLDLNRLSDEYGSSLNLCSSSFSLSVGRVVGFEPTIFWATTRRVNPYTIPAMLIRISARPEWYQNQSQSARAIFKILAVLMVPKIGNEKRPFSQPFFSSI